MLQPGRVAQVGLDAAHPLLDSISDLMGFVSFFENFLQIVILLVAWAVVIIAFFILSIQLFITLIEFKLTTLCGFVLIPFGLFGKTAFMAERVLGNVVSSGIKVLVLAVIVGIGSTIFSEFTSAISGEPTIEDALSIMLASLALLGLGIFGPGIANGIVSGGPQLGAGRCRRHRAARRRGGRRCGRRCTDGGRRGSQLQPPTSRMAPLVPLAARPWPMHSALPENPGASAVGSGMAAVGDAAVGAATSPLRKAGDSMKQSFRDGSRAAVTNTGGTITPGPNTPAPPPAEPDQGQPSLGQGDEEPPDHHPQRHARRPHIEGRRQPRRRCLHRHFGKGLTHVSTPNDPLRQDP